MPRIAQAGDKVQETWEITTEGTVWVWIYDRREDKYRKQRVGGRQGGSKRLHITSEDRRFNQEQVVDEMKPNDPFTNGALRLVSSARSSDIDDTYHLGPQDLRVMLNVVDEDEFQSNISGITSELILRRLKDVAELHGTVAQLRFIEETIEARYKVGGTQRTVQEMIDAGEKLGGTQLS